MRYKKNIIIIVMCISIFIMGIGYALISTQMNIYGSSAITSNWKIEFSDIRTKELHGGATNVVKPTIEGTRASFEVDLVLPGDHVLYEIDITNYGDIDAEVKGATYSVSGSDAIFVVVDGIKKGTDLPSCEGLDTCPTITLFLRVGYDGKMTTTTTEKSKSIEFNIEVGQVVKDNPIPESDLIPELAASTLVDKIFLNNKAYADNVKSEFVDSDTGINFGAISSDTNGKGLYYTSTNTENNAMSYYFRGNVTNNYVSFAGYVWRIVRINEDGSVRLITQDTIGESRYNLYSSDNAYVGYMYGKTEATGDDAYNLTHANTHDSKIKIYLDNWYVNNLKNYADYLADAGFCNDRSTGTKDEDTLDVLLGYGENITYYGSYYRILKWFSNSYKPQLKCPHPTNDLFTTNTSSKGNKALTYPIGLITADEVVYAGVEDNKMNTSVYINNGNGYWTMTPVGFFEDDQASVWYYSNLGENYIKSVGFELGVRPVINLNSSVQLSSELPEGCTEQNGTEACPYIIKTN